MLRFVEQEDSKNYITNSNQIILKEHIFFCDEEFEHDQPGIEQLLALTPEQREAVRVIEEGYRLLCERGGSLISYDGGYEWFAVNNLNGVDVTTTNWEYEKLEKEGYTDISEIVEKQTIKFSYDFEWAIDGCMYAKINNKINEQL